MNSAEAWAVLRNYESKELVRRLYQERHDRDASAGLAREISCAIGQAREYFKNARTADPIVKPLLLYYGVMNLARGAIMFLAVNRREATLSPRHGLSEISWRDMVANDLIDVSALQFRIEKAGTIVEFAEATEHRTLLRVQKSIVTDEVASPFQGEVIATLGDLLSRIPELARQYRRWKTPQLSLAAEWQRLNDSVQITVRRDQGGRRVSDKDVAAVFAGCNYGVTSTEPDKFVLVAPHDASSPMIWDSINKHMFDIGHVVLVARFPGNQELSKPVAVYALAYVLGMLVRYFPSLWMALLRNERGDAALPTLLEAIAYVEEYFPLLTADFLERNRK